MKRTKYIILDKEGLKDGVMLFPSIFTSLNLAKKVKKMYEKIDDENREELSHQDIDIEPTEYHIYKLEQVD